MRITRHNNTIVRIILVIVSLVLLVTLGAMTLHMLPQTATTRANTLKAHPASSILATLNIPLTAATYPQPGVPSEIPVAVHITRHPGSTALPPRDQDYTSAASVKALWEAIWHLPFIPVQGDVRYCPYDNELSYDIRFTFIDTTDISGHAQASGCSGLVIGGRGTLALTPAFWQALQAVMGEPAQ